MAQTRIDDFFRLFVKREWRVVLGKHYSTLWLLTGMLTVTFMAIAFSSASMNYLSVKMNDPFHQWVDINENYGEGRNQDFISVLSHPDTMNMYHYESVNRDNYQSHMFFINNSNAVRYFRCRFFESLRNPLIDKILSDDNVVDGMVVPDFQNYPEQTIGVILSESAVKKLGYDKAPAYIDLQEADFGADSLGFEVRDGFYHLPLPVLAVVKRLPSEVDVIASKFFVEQDMNDRTYPYNFAVNPQYAYSLRYFVPIDILDDFKEYLSAKLDSFTTPAELDDKVFNPKHLLPYVDGDFVSIIGKKRQILNSAETTEINREVMEEWKGKGVFRIYDYNFSPYTVNVSERISVFFNNLDRIKEFEVLAKQYDVKIDMSQVNAKDNFNVVSNMASILSWSIIFFAMACIVLFIVNLLQSYFQKVKRNIGTFKAFGVSNKRLISIYGLIVSSTVAISLALALTITALVQVVFYLAGIMKDGIYPYFSLINVKTLIALTIILSSSVATVFFVMKKLLTSTPGDLIYDRQ